MSLGLRRALRAALTGLSVILPATTMVAALPTPAAAHGPLAMVATGPDGDLVHLMLDTATSSVTARHVLLDSGARTTYTAGHVRAGVVAAVGAVEKGSGVVNMNVTLVDAPTGAVGTSTEDDRTGQVLVTDDGSARIVLRSDADGDLVSVVRTDAAGSNETTLVPRQNGVVLSRAALAWFGTLYVARTESSGRPSALLAIDTATGAQRVVTYLAPFEVITDIALAPNGRTLALTFADDVSPLGTTHRVGVLDNADHGGPIRPVPIDADVRASGFTFEGDQFMLTRTAPGGQTDIVLAELLTLETAPVAASAGLAGALAAY